MRLTVYSFLLALLIPFVCRADSVWQEMDELCAMSMPAPTVSWNPISGLVGHWTMNDSNANTVVVDNIGSNNGANVRNTALVSTNGVVNKALAYNGLVDSDRTTISTAYGITKYNSFSVVFWMYIPSLPNRGAMVKIGSTTTGNTILMGNNDSADSSITLLHEYVVWIPTGYTFPSTGWFHIGWVFQPNTPNTRNIVYVNGVSVYDATSTSITSPGSATIYLGGYKATNGNNRYYKGSLDDVRIYNRALTASEISAIYNGGSGTEKE